MPPDIIGDSSGLQVNAECRAETAEAGLALSRLR